MRHIAMVGLWGLLLALWPAGADAAALPCGHLDTTHGRHRDTTRPDHATLPPVPCPRPEGRGEASSTTRPKTPLRPPVRCSRADGQVLIIRYREDLPPPGWCADIDPESCPGNGGDTTDYSCYPPEFRPPSAR